MDREDEEKEYGISLDIILGGCIFWSSVYQCAWKYIYREVRAVQQLLFHTVSEFGGRL